MTGLWKGCGRLVLLGLLVAATALAGTRSARAMSDAEQEVTFWTIAVLPLQGKVGRLSGAQAAARMAIGLRDTRHFKIIPPKQVAEGLKKAGIKPADVKGGLSKSDLKKLSKVLPIDGVVVGTMTPDGQRVLLDLRLVNKSGRLFGSFKFKVSEQFTRPEAIRAALQFSRFLPYEGLIVRIDGSQALVNVGTSQGVKAGATLYAFELNKIRSGKKGYTGADRNLVAELQVLRASRFGAWVRPTRGEMPARLSKVSTKPVEGAIKAPEAPKFQAKEAWLSFGVGVGFLSKSYVLESDTANFTSDTTFFPAPGIDVQWILHSTNKGYIATNLGFHHGFIPFRRTVNNQEETYAGSIDQGYVEAAYARGLGKRTEVYGSAGFRYFAFTVEEQDPLILTSDTYLQPTLGVGGQVEVFSWLGLNARRRVLLLADVRGVPFAFVSQTPVDNGSGTAFGGYGAGGIQLSWNKRLAVTATYGADFVATKFEEGGGSRGLTAPTSRDFYHGFAFRVDYRLLK